MVNLAPQRRGARLIQFLAGAPEKIQNISPQLGAQSAKQVGPEANVFAGPRGIIAENAAGDTSIPLSPSGETHNESSQSLSQADLDATALQGWRSGHLDGVRINYNLREPREQLWVVMPSGKVRYIGVIGSGRPVSVPHNRKAIFHSHPKWSEPVPGPGDYDESVPIYGFSRKCLWRLRPGEQSETVLAGGC